VVFSAGPSNVPVAYSNLVAWYPFDSAEYGGSDADDVTAIIGSSGDDTAYDGSVSGPTYQSSGGVTDIRAGASSGAYDFAAGSDEIDIGLSGVNESTFTICFFVNIDSQNGGYFYDSNTSDRYYFYWQSAGGNPGKISSNFGGQTDINLNDFSAINNWIHIAQVHDGTSMNYFINGSFEDSVSNSDDLDPSAGFVLGGFNFVHLDGTMDDFRVYNTDLSNSQINQIYLNTQP